MSARALFSPTLSALTAVALVLSLGTTAWAHEDDADAPPEPVPMTPELGARLDRALNVLLSTDPSLREPASKVEIVFVRNNRVIDSYFDAEAGVVGVNSEANECTLASFLGHELTHVRRLGVGPGSAMVAPRQKTAAEYASFMVDEEAEAFLVQVKVARRMRADPSGKVFAAAPGAPGSRCVDALPAPIVAFETRTWGKSDDEARSVFVQTYDFNESYRQSYILAFERKMAARFPGQQSDR